MKFYMPNMRYLDYLREFDKKIMKVNPDYQNNKFVLGAVFEINGISYYVPVSSFKPEKHSNVDGALKPKYKKTCLGIEDKTDKILSLLRFDYMFPIPNSEIIELDISSLSGSYKNLVQKEYIYCKKNLEHIQEKAHSVYIKAKNPTHYLNSQCCDFGLLEVEYVNWIKQKKS